MADFAGAWVFYSVLPGLPWVEPSFRRIARFAPWIGLTLGAIQVGFWLLLTFLGWPTIAVAPLLLAFGIWFSGGLHHDGLMDTADGLGGLRVVWRRWRTVASVPVEFWLWPWCC